MALAVGLWGSVAAVVTPADTAAALGSGDVPVLGTPRVLALAEAASVRAVAEALPPHRTTVGTRVELRHRAAAAVGTAVRAEAELTGVDGDRLEFRVSVRAGEREVADGTLVRAVVDQARFAG